MSHGGEPDRRPEAGSLALPAGALFSNALAAGLMKREEFDQGIQNLCRTSEPDGVFRHTFFKAAGNKR